MARWLPQIQRFWRNVKREAGAESCWNYQLSTNKDGYGHGYFDGKVTDAHRIAWALYKGQISDGLQVLHKCDNPACCNPDHLFLGTHLDNMRDKAIKGRARPLKGENSNFHKLTDANVLFIRSNQNSFTGKKFSEMFSVTEGAISKVLNGKTWKHLLEPISRPTSVSVGNAAIAPCETRRAEILSQ